MTSLTSDEFDKTKSNGVGVINNGEWGLDDTYDGYLRGNSSNYAGTSFHLTRLSMKGS